jgi:hypothetical protein
MGVGLPLRFDLGTGNLKLQGPVHNQAIIWTAEVERFNERVVDGLAQPGEVEYDIEVTA